MTTDPKIEAGDVVIHVPTQEEWLVKGVDGDWLEWCGWPPGRARLSDCTLVRKGTEEERLAVLAGLK